MAWLIMQISDMFLLLYNTKPTTIIHSNHRSLQYMSDTWPMEWTYRFLVHTGVSFKDDYKPTDFNCTC